jgi:hypothetical protein
MSKNMRQLINEFKKFNGHRKILTEVSLSRIWQHIQNEEYLFEVIDRTTADKYRGIKYNDTDLIKLL